MATGNAEILLEAFEGRPLGSVNFVYVDNRDRIWVTISTRTEPRIKSLTDPIADGYILVVEDGRPRLAADGLYFTNEVRIDSAGTTLYIAETTAGRVSRCAIRPDGTLGPRSAFGPDPLYPGARIDGITFDAAGNLWVTELTRNALVVVDPDGRAYIAIENPDGRLFDAPSCVTFGGEDLRTAYVGSLTMSRIATFRVEVPGVPLRHWDRPARAPQQNGNGVA
jgi:sugar lactone lactonase YvrE